MFGIETIAVLDIDGILAHIMGHYDEHCDDGEYVGFDIYVKNERSNILELVDLGQAFSHCPSDKEVSVIVYELFNPTAVRVLANA